MGNKIVITGATGLIGRKIANKLIARGDEVVVLTRSLLNAKKKIPGANKYILWNNYNINELKEELEASYAIIHLAGENVMAKRWTEAHKKNIYESRITTTKNLVNIIEQLNNKPNVFVCASAVGYYGNSVLPVDEYSDKGNDFLANVVSDWENESQKVKLLGIRNVNIRTGIVLDKYDGALAKMLLPYKFFVGGSIGSGKQWFPWIHIDDATEIFLFALDNKNVEGILNAVAPESINMNRFSKALGKVLRRPSFFKVPELALKVVLGEGASSVLGGANVISKRTLDYGYKFKFDNIKKSLIDLLQ